MVGIVFASTHNHSPEVKVEERIQEKYKFFHVYNKK